MQLRLATRADLPALAELIPLAVRELSAGYYSPAQIEAANRHIFGPDTRLIDDGTYFVAWVIDPPRSFRLVGAGGWGKRRTLYGGDQARPAQANAGDDPLLDPACEPARLRAFYVHPEFARRGIATRIVDACLAAARAEGFRAIELLATLPGVPLYRHLGFDVVTPYDAPLPDGMTLPCLVMRRELLTQPSVDSA